MSIALHLQKIPQAVRRLPMSEISNQVILMFSVPLKKRSKQKKDVSLLMFPVFRQVIITG